MGWTVLYIAFGIVALWLLGEVLLQYKARLRWRLLAFAGFLGVVARRAASRRCRDRRWARSPSPSARPTSRSPSAAASRPAGRSAASPGASRRRRSGAATGPRTRRLEVTDLQAADGGTCRRDDFDPGDDRTAARTSVFGQHAETAAETTAVYEPQPLPDDTGNYGVYSDDRLRRPPPTRPTRHPPRPRTSPARTTAYDGYSGYDQQQYGYDHGPAAVRRLLRPVPRHADVRRHGLVRLSPTTPRSSSTSSRATPRTSTRNGGYGGETPPGGVWVPQQRDTDDPYGGELPPEQQQYPYEGNGNGQRQRVRRAVPVLSTYRV